MTDRQGFARDEHDPRKRLSPAAARNKQPILEVLQRYLPQAPPKSIDVLELAAGTGEHAAHLAVGLPQVRSWQPTEYPGHAGPTFEQQELDDIFDSIVAHTLSNPIIKPPVMVDAASKVRHYPMTSILQPAASNTSTLPCLSTASRCGRWSERRSICSVMRSLAAGRDLASF